MEQNCIFCQIANGKSPAEVEYEDSEVMGFWDIHPQAPVHIVIIPKKHISTIANITEADFNVLGRMFLAANEIAQKKNLSDSGYRLIINYGRNAGLVVEHLHMHLIGGKNLGGLA